MNSKTSTRTTLWLNTRLDLIANSDLQPMEYCSESALSPKPTPLALTTSSPMSKPNICQMRLMALATSPQVILRCWCTTFMRIHNMSMTKIQCSTMMLKGTWLGGSQAERCLANQYVLCNEWFGCVCPCVSHDLCHLSVSSTTDFILQ